MKNNELNSLSVYDKETNNINNDLKEISVYDNIINKDIILNDNVNNTLPVKNQILEDINLYEDINNSIHEKKIDNLIKSNNIV